MNGLVDEGTAVDIAHLDFSKAFDTVSLTVEQMEDRVNKTENRLKGMVSGTKFKWSPILSNILINDVDDGQSIPTSDRELRVVAGVLGGCAVIQGRLGRLEKWVAGTSWSSGRSAKSCGPGEEEAPVFAGD